MSEESLPSNGIRLTHREWILVVAMTTVAVILLPVAWSYLERFDPGGDYRVPEALSEDYWTFRQAARRAAHAADVLVIGDSVVWGAYVKEDQTLSHYLSRDDLHCANLGLPGGHPAATEGLLRYHGGAVRGKTVLLHCNPLWVSSPRHDLSEEKEFRFNHPELVPQLWPRVPCYRADASERLGIIATRRLVFSAWTRHLQHAFLGGQTFPAWSLEHPYESPLALHRTQVGSRHDRPAQDHRSWIERDIARQSFDWVNLDHSLQWAAFRRTVGLLQERDNRLLVLVGPFNEHMLTETDLRRYQHVRRGIEDWLTANHVAHLAPPPLPSSLYADASHPLPAGYARLASQCGAQQVLLALDPPP